jgi:hypothetical protein
MAIGVVFCTRWFKYDRDYLCVNKSQFVPVIFEPPCTLKTRAEGTTKTKKRVWMKYRVQKNTKKSRRWHACLCCVL